VVSSISGYNPIYYITHEKSRGNITLLLWKWHMSIFSVSVWAYCNKCTCAGHNSTWMVETNEGDVFFGTSLEISEKSHGAIVWLLNIWGVGKITFVYFKQFGSVCLSWSIFISPIFPDYYESKMTWVSGPVLVPPSSNMLYLSASVQCVIFSP
jgi:hypothetical protein